MDFPRRRRNEGAQHRYWLKRQLLMIGLRKLHIAWMLTIAMLAQLRTESPGTNMAPATIGEIVFDIQSGTPPSESHKTDSIRLSQLPREVVGLSLVWPDASVAESWTFVPNGEKSKFTF